MLFVRLVSAAETRDVLYMETYSGETRVELTALGCLYVATRRLNEKLNTSSKAKQSQLEREAKSATRAAIKMLSADKLAPAATPTIFH